MNLRIRRLSYNLGAEIIGVDIRKPLDDKSFGAVHAAFLEHGILLFRGQRLTQEQHIAFSRRFGELDNNDISPRDRHPQHPEVLMVSNKPNSSWQPTVKPVGRIWHSDRAYTCLPAMASLLRGVEVPEVGGDTMFANMYLAYETLSDGMKKLIGGLEGVHQGGKRRIDNSTPERAAETKRLNPAVAQPLVRVHPETGRKTLYVGEKVQRFVGMTAEESKPLIRFLCEHATRPQFVYRHQWQKDDLVIWDNRCTMHNAVMDFDQSQFRHMERTTVMGTPSGYVYDDIDAE